MPFNSESGSIAGSISKRGTAKVSHQIKLVMSNILDGLINELSQADDLTNREKIELVKILSNLCLSKGSEYASESEYIIEIIKKKDD